MAHQSCLALAHLCHRHTTRRLAGLPRGRRWRRSQNLAWFRKVLRIPAQNGRRVALLEPLPAQVSCMHACVHARGRGVCASMCVRGPPSSAQNARPPCNCTVPQDGRGYVYRMSLEVTAPGASAPTSATLYARKVVLATGIQGGGEWHVPRFIQQVRRATWRTTASGSTPPAWQGARAHALTRPGRKARHGRSDGEPAQPWLPRGGTE